MKFREYLLEIGSNPSYDVAWVKTLNNGTVISNIHIDNDDKSVHVNNSKFESGCTSFEVMFIKIKNEDIPHPTYTIKFLDEDNSTSATGLGADVSKTLFGAIEKVFEKMIDYIPNDSLVFFSADKNERNRTNIYDRFIDKISKVYPHIFRESDIRKIDNTHLDKKVYGFAKNKQAYLDAMALANSKP